MILETLIAVYTKLFNYCVAKNTILDEWKSADNSIFIKIGSIYDILDLGTFDILFINESKKDNSVPDSYLSHNRYNSGVAEFGRHGGGLLIRLL